MVDDPVEHRVSLTAEHATIARSWSTGDRVRVETVTRAQEHVVDAETLSERVEVSHVQIGREVETAPEIVRDGDLTIIPVMEEVLVWRRRLILKEEIHVRRIKIADRRQETVTLRTQEAVITRTRGEDGMGAGPEASIQQPGERE